MNDSYKIYASKDYVDSKALPEGAGAYQQLVTNANGEKKWEDRTHYLGEKRTLVFPEYTYTGQSFSIISSGGAWTQALSAGQKYAVIYNGTEYTGIVKWNEIIYTNVVGNESLNSLGNDTGEPFFFNNTKPNQECFLFFDTNGEHTISVYLVEDEIHPINEEYIPTTVPVVPTAAVGQTIAVKSVDENDKPTEWETIDPWTITSPNGTQFKLTIDDEGILSATELT